MIENANFMPVIQPAEWQGRSECVVRCVTGKPSVVPGFPVLVSYGLVNEATNEYLSKGDLEQSTFDLREANKRALLNWKRAYAGLKWEVVKVSEKETCLAMRNKELTSSAILFSGILNAAHQHFKSDQIFVGIPDRFSVVAGKEPLLFGHMVEGMFQDAIEEQMAPLSPSVLMVMHGKVSGHAAPKGRELPTADARARGVAKLEFKDVMGPCFVLVIVAGAAGKFDSKDIRIFSEVVQTICTRPKTPQAVKGVYSQVAERADEIIQTIVEHGAEDALAGLAASAESVGQKFGQEIERNYAKSMVHLAKKLVTDNPMGGLFNRKLAARRQASLQVVQQALSGSLSAPDS
jgi:hypothetical protein